MESHRHKTQKHINNEITETIQLKQTDEGPDNTLKALLEGGAKEAYSRPWHRIERGLRLNRIRIFIEEISEEHNLTKEEKEQVFVFLQKALDKKLLNTLKVVQYDQEEQKIKKIFGFEMKRSQENTLKLALKQKTESTRKKKKAE